MGAGIRRPGGFSRGEARGDVPVLRRVGAGGSGELRRRDRRRLAQRRAVGERAVGRRVQRGCVGGSGVQRCGSRRSGQLTADEGSEDGSSGGGAGYIRHHAGVQRGDQRGVPG